VNITRNHPVIRLIMRLNAKSPCAFVTVRPADRARVGASDV